MEKTGTLTDEENHGRFFGKQYAQFFPYNRCLSIDNTAGKQKSYQVYFVCLPLTTGEFFETAKNKEHKRRLTESGYTTYYSGGNHLAVLIA